MSMLSISFQILLKCKEIDFTNMEKMLQVLSFI